MGERLLSVPKHLKGDYLTLLRTGLDPAAAHALLAYREGLKTEDGQRTPWNLEDLAKLEFVAARTANLPR